MVIHLCQWLDRQGMTYTAAAMFLVTLAITMGLILGGLIEGAGQTNREIDRITATEQMQDKLDAVGGLMPEECPPGSVTIVNERSE